MLGRIRHIEKYNKQMVSLKDGGMQKVSRREYQDSLRKLQDSFYKHPLLSLKDRK